MPRGIDPDDWSLIHEVACDIVNASAVDDHVLTESHKQRMLVTLDEFREKYGDHPSLLATIGDYLDSPEERKQHYDRALKIAKAANYREEVDEILDSIMDFQQETGNGG